MAVRSTMAAVIARLRLLINDPAGVSQQFADQDIQDVLDANRQDVQYLALDGYPTYSGNNLLYLDYYTSMGDWENNTTLWQYRTLRVTPSLSEPIVGHWQFAQTTLPPVFLLGSTFDVYRAAADLLERLSARWALSYDVNVDGQSLRRSQALPALLALARQYRMQQRPVLIDASRSDLNAGSSGPSLSPTELDYMGSGDGR